MFSCVSYRCTKLFVVFVVLLGASVSQAARPWTARHVPHAERERGDIRNRPVAHLHLPTKMADALKDEATRRGVAFSVGELLQMPRVELLRMHGVGKKIMTEGVAHLESLGLQLESTASNWKAPEALAEHSQPHAGFVVTQKPRMTEHDALLALPLEILEKMRALVSEQLDPKQLAVLTKKVLPERRGETAPSHAALRGELGVTRERVRQLGRLSVLRMGDHIARRLDLDSIRAGEAIDYWRGDPVTAIEALTAEGDSP